MTFVCRGKVFLVFPETNNNNLRDKKKYLFMTLIDRNSHFFLSVADCVIRARWQLWKKEKEGCDSKPSSWLTFWPDLPKLARKEVFPLLFLEKSALCSSISEDKYELCVQLLMENQSG